MVFRYCFGMIMSVSTLMIFRGAATPSSVVNLSIDRTSRLKWGTGPLIYREYGPGKRPICAILACACRPRSPPYRRRTARNGGRSRGSARGGRCGPASPRARPSNPGSAGGRARPCWAGGRCRHCSAAAGRRPGTGRAGRIRSRACISSSTSSVGKSSTRMITPSHRVAKALRQALEHLVRHGFHFGERGRFCFGPHRRYVFSACSSANRSHQLGFARAPPVAVDLGARNRRPYGPISGCGWTCR